MSGRSRHGHYVMSSSRHRRNLVYCDRLCSAVDEKTHGGKPKCSGVLTINCACLLNRPTVKSRRRYTCQVGALEARS
jgi:hypothetical protein